MQLKAKYLFNQAVEVICSKIAVGVGAGLTAGAYSAPPPQTLHVRTNAQIKFLHYPLTRIKFFTFKYLALKLYNICTQSNICLQFEFDLVYNLKKYWTRFFDAILL